MSGSNIPLKQSHIVTRSGVVENSAVVRYIYYLFLPPSVLISSYSTHLQTLKTIPTVLLQSPSPATVGTATTRENMTAVLPLTVPLLEYLTQASVIVLRHTSCHPETWPTSICTMRPITRYLLVPVKLSPAFYTTTPHYLDSVLFPVAELFLTRMPQSPLCAL